TKHSYLLEVLLRNSGPMALVPFQTDTYSRFLHPKKPWLVECRLSRPTFLPQLRSASSFNRLLSKFNSWSLFDDDVYDSAQLSRVYDKRRRFELQKMQNSRGNMCHYSADMCHYMDDMWSASWLASSRYSDNMCEEFKVEVKSEGEHIDYIDIKRETFRTSEDAELE
ncbi:hypothetical protein L9F63_019695, partial [Diploptera punctata]